MTEFIYNQHIQRELTPVQHANASASHNKDGEYDPYCPAWLRVAESEKVSPEAHAAPTRSKSRKQKHTTGVVAPHLQISLPTSNPNFNQVSTSPLQRNRSMSKRKPEKLTLNTPQFPLSVHERQRKDGQKSETPRPNFMPPQVPKPPPRPARPARPQHNNIQTNFKKVNSPMRAEFFNHDLTSDIKFEYQQSIIEFLNYIIGKYKQLEEYTETSKLEWNETAEKSLVLLNLMKIKDGFKDMILSILKQLSKESGIVNQKEVSEAELINCNVFQFVYNCSIEVVNFGDLINNSALLNNLFKSNLLSYYFKLDFIIEKAVHHRDQLAVAMEVWFKLPTFIKSIKDQLAKLNNHDIKMGANNGIKRNYQDLEICLVKLNSVTSKFSTVDNLKRNYPILKWTDLNKVDELLKVKVPDYYPQHNLVQQDRQGRNLQLHFVDFNDRPLSTAGDTNIVHGLHSNYKLDPKAGKREAAAASKSKVKHSEPESKPKSTLSRGASIKRSLSSMVKRSVSTSDTEKNKPKSNNFFTSSTDNKSRQQMLRSQTTKAPRSTQPVQTTPPRQQEVTTPPKRMQSLQENKQVLDIADDDDSPSRTKMPTRSPSKKDIRHMLKNRPLPSAPEATAPIAGEQSIPNSQLQSYVTCLVQLRKKLKALGPQLIEFLEIQLKYCRLWQKFLEDDGHTVRAQGRVDPYIKSIYQSFHEKLLHQINFTQHTIVRHINSKLIMPIDECLQLYRQSVTDLSYIHQFMELIVRQYNKLYCEWLEGLIGAQSIAEYQQLCQRMKGCPGMKKGDDIVEYYEQLTKLKNLVV
ncbi:FAV1 [Candida metapsilosis]|uniref:FAV1 n=1 Tax=Candida metapsilosis TaxID=273372 RepID=A0A8H7ZJR2_9ASCO|nr:FAV1 [Candida metapsilosis]